MTMTCHRVCTGGQLALLLTPLPPGSHFLSLAPRSCLVLTLGARLVVRLWARLPPHPEARLPPLPPHPATTPTSSHVPPAELQTRPDSTAFWTSAWNAPHGTLPSYNELNSFPWGMWGAGGEELSPTQVWPLGKEKDSSSSGSPTPGEAAEQEEDRLGFSPPSPSLPHTCQAPLSSTQHAHPHTVDLAGGRTF